MRDEKYQDRVRYDLEMSRHRAVRGHGLSMLLDDRKSGSATVDAWSRTYLMVPRLQRAVRKHDKTYIMCLPTSRHACFLTLFAFIVCFALQ